MVNRDYFLKSERLLFGKWQDDDFSLAQKLWSNHDTCRYISKNGFFNDDEIKERLNKEITNQISYGIQYWPLFTADDNEFVGCCGFRPYKEGVYELGFHLLPAYWYKGLAYEAAYAAITYLFSNTDIFELAAGHHPANVASSKVLRKLGFECMGLEFYAPTGLKHPTYRLRRSDHTGNNK